LTSELTPIRAFLSYARADDAEFVLVDPLVNKLKALVKVKSGRTLDVFVDRESIGWGENWRERLSASVEAATVFIPLLTATYLDSPACREEFLAFYSKAEVLGVTELLLPVLVFKSPLFGPDNSDEIVQIAEALQYECIEDALLEGVESAAWLQRTRDLAEGLLSAIARAEEALGERVTAIVSTPQPPGDEDDPDESGLAELLEVMNDAIDEMVEIAAGLESHISGLGDAAAALGDLPDDATTNQYRLWSIRLAEALKAPALGLEVDGHKLLSATQRLDQAVVGIKQLADDIEVPDLQSSLLAGLRKVIDNMGDISEVAVSMDDLLTSMRPAEVLSVPLRKSLKPARRGLTAVRDSIRLIGTWGNLVDG
jgi:TIR domain